MENEPVKIFKDSPEAAVLVTGLSAWKSRNGHYFLTDQADAESLARLDGSTHAVCECGETMERYWLKCATCREKAAKEKYDATPKVKWDGKTPVFSEVLEHYFFDGEFEEMAEDEGVKIEDMRLVLCSPVYATPIDPADYYVDELPEDFCYLPAPLEEAFEELNEKIKAYKEPLSWIPTQTPVDVSPVEDSLHV
jgi:hypothetical protein